MQRITGKPGGAASWCDEQTKRNRKRPKFASLAKLRHKHYYTTRLRSNKQATTRNQGQEAGRNKNYDATSSSSTQHTFAKRLYCWSCRMKDTVAAWWFSSTEICNRLRVRDADTETGRESVCTSLYLTASLVPELISNALLLPCKSSVKKRVCYRSDDKEPENRRKQHQQQRNKL